MKKLLAIFLALFLVIGLAACGGNDKPTEPDNSDPIVEETKPEVSEEKVCDCEECTNEDGECEEDCTCKNDENPGDGETVGDDDETTGDDDDDE